MKNTLGLAPVLTKASGSTLVLSSTAALLAIELASAVAAGAVEATAVATVAAVGATAGFAALIGEEATALLPALLLLLDVVVTVRLLKRKFISCGHLSRVRSTC